MLEQQGKLSYDDAISLFIDGVPYGKGNINLHHLLTHSSGITGDFASDIEHLSKILLSQESLDKLFTPHISENNRGVMWRGYGFGIENNEEFGMIITHNGGESR